MITQQVALFCNTTLGNARNLFKKARAMQNFITARKNITAAISFRQTG
jgi:hypothetical protein